MTTAVAASASPSSTRKGFHIGLGIVQGLLAVAFGMAGFMKLTQPIDALVAGGVVWAGAVPEALVRFIGASELAGAIGLVLPAATRIQPRLTALAGAGLTLVMTLALAFHISRGEFGALPVNLVLGGLAASVAYGRTKLAAIAPRS